MKRFFFAAFKPHLIPLIRNTVRESTSRLLSIVPHREDFFVRPPSRRAICRKLLAWPGSRKCCILRICEVKSSEDGGHLLTRALGCSTERTRYGNCKRLSPEINRIKPQSRTKSGCSRQVTWAISGRRKQFSTQ